MIDYLVMELRESKGKIEMTLQLKELEVNNLNRDVDNLRKKLEVHSFNRG